MHRPRNPPHNIQHLIARNQLPIRIPKRSRNPRARRRNRRKPHLLKNARTRHIPNIRQNQNPPAMMQLPQLFRFPRLPLYVHLSFDLTSELPIQSRNIRHSDRSERRLFFAFVPASASARAVEEPLFDLKFAPRFFSIDPSKSSPQQLHRLFMNDAIRTQIIPAINRPLPRTFVDLPPPPPQ